MKSTLTRLTLGVLLAATTGSTVNAGEGPGCGQASGPPPDGCSAGSAKLPLGESRILAPSGRAEIAFRMHGHHVLVPVSVDGSEPFHVVLDTGMPIPGLILHPSPRTDALELKNPDGLKLVLGGDPAPDSRLGVGLTLALPGVELTQQLVAVDPVPCMKPEARLLQAESAVDGVIGLSIFGNFTVTIDYDRRVITLVEPERFRHTGRGHEVPLSLGTMGVPEIACAVEMRPGERVPVRVAVDTGATYTLSLTLGTNDDIYLPAGARELVEGYSLWGRVTGSLGRVSALHIGDLALRDPLITFFKKGAPGVPPCGENGILGNEALSRFKTTFDYARKRMILEPGRSVHEPFEIDMSGLHYVKTDAGLQVAAVLPESPASEAGLLEGDVVTAVNGRPTTECSEERLRGLLRQNGASVQLRVTRGGRELDVTLRLRRLV